MSTFHLKVIAAAAMVFDHLKLCLPDSFPLWFHWIGRISAPLFLYSAAAGFAKTKNRYQYLFRLYVGAVTVIILHECAATYEFGNFFVSLFQGGLILLTIDAYRKKKKFLQSWGYYLLFQFFSTGSVVLLNAYLDDDVFLNQCVLILLKPLSVYRMDGGLILVGIIVIFYLFRKEKKKLGIAFTVYCLFYVFLVKTSIIGVIIYVSGECFDFAGAQVSQWILNDIIGIGGFGWALGPDVSLLTENYQWMMIFSLIPIFLTDVEKHNASSGKKWFFYVFYPLHMLALKMLLC